MNSKQVDPNKAVAFLVKHGMDRDDARLFVSYLTTGLMSEVRLLDGRYRVARAGGVTSPLMFEISVRRLTGLERGEEAVAKHACPFCKAVAGKGCKWPTTGRLLKHPHPERVKLVKDEQP